LVLSLVRAVAGLVVVRVFVPQLLAAAVAALGLGVVGVVIVAAFFVFFAFV